MFAEALWKRLSTRDGKKKIVSLSRELLAQPIEKRGRCRR